MNLLLGPDEENITDIPEIWLQIATVEKVILDVRHEEIVAIFEPTAVPCF